MSEDLIISDLPCGRCLSHLGKWTVGDSVKHCEVSRTASVKCKTCQVNKKPCVFPYGVLAAVGLELYQYIAAGDIEASQLDRLQLAVRKELQRKKTVRTLPADKRAQYQEDLEEERAERNLLARENVAKQLRIVATQLSRLDQTLKQHLVAHTDGNAHLSNVAATLKRSLDDSHPVAQAVGSLQAVVQGLAGGTVIARPAKRARTASTRPRLERAASEGAGVDHSPDLGGDPYGSD